MHSGFSSLRSALPMNLKRTFPGHKVWARALADIERITAIWRECLAATAAVSLRRAVHGRRDVRAGRDAIPHLRRQARLAVHGVRRRIMAMPEMNEWVGAAKREPDDIDELDMEF